MKESTTPEIVSETPEMNVESVNSPEAENMLERAKAEGLKVTKEGKIVLPGALKSRPAVIKAKKTTKAAPKAKKEKVVKEKIVKEAKPRISSDIFSTGSTMNNLSEGLSIMASVLAVAGVKNYKMSTYKNEFRIVFDNVTGAELIGHLTKNQAGELNSLGFTAPDKKDFLSITIG